MINNPYSKIGTKAVSGFIWLFTGSGVQIMFQFFVTLILARVLDPVEFGVISAMTIVISFGNIIAMLGVGPALVQKETINEAHITTAYYFSIFINLVISVFVFFASDLLSFLLKVSELSILLKVMSIIFIIQGFSVVSESLLQRDLQFRTLAKIQMSSFLCYAFVAVILAYSGFGVWSLAIAVLIQNIVKSKFLMMFKRHSKSLRVDFCLLKELLFYGTGFSIGRISNFFAVQGDNMIVSRYLGSEALGLYGRAYQIMTMPANLIGQVLSDVLFSIMSRLQDDPIKLRAYYLRLVSLTVTLIAPISIVTIFFSKNIVIFLFGVKWLDVTVPLQILAAGMVFRTVGKINDSLAKATGAVYKRAWRQLFYALSVIIGSFVGQRWGISGVALGVLVALTFNYIMLTQLSKSLLRFTWADIFKGHVPGIILSVIYFFVAYVCANNINAIFDNNLILIIVTFFVCSVVFIFCMYVCPKWTVGLENVKLIHDIKGILINRIQKNKKHLKDNA